MCVSNNKYIDIPVCTIFSLYIDPLSDRLRMSGFGCRIKGVYMGALSYADDITIMCPSIGGLNEMLKSCYIFCTK